MQLLDVGFHGFVPRLLQGGSGVRNINKLAYLLSQHFDFLKTSPGGIVRDNPNSLSCF